MPIGPITPGVAVDVTPDTDPAPLALVQAPTASMDVIGTNMQALTLAALNMQASVVPFANIGTTDIRIGKIYVNEIGWYHHLAGGFTPDAFWVISGTSGIWVHELVTTVNQGKLAAVGPVPGGVYTPAIGRISKSIVDHGFFSNVYVSTAEARTLIRAPEDPLTPAAELRNYALGAVQIGDIIKCEIYAGVKCDSAFVVGTFISENNGSTYALRSPQRSATLPLLYPQPSPTGHFAAVELSFTYVVAQNNNAFVSIRGYTDGVQVMTLMLGSTYIEVMRP